MQSTEDLSGEQRSVLLKTARESIRNGLHSGAPLEVDAALFDPRLAEPGATFVTLKLEHRLRGCIGSLQAHRPLIEDVAANAWASAFRDPRFPPLTAAEFDPLVIEISLLGAPQEFPVRDRDDLLQQLRPGEDGLIVQAGNRRATFLPAVWESLPQASEFLHQLWLKAGLAPESWPEGIHLMRYGALKFGEEDPPA